MKKNKRNAFIEQYHLKSLSKDLSLKLRANHLKEEKIEFVLAFKNISEKSFYLYKKRAYLGDLFLSQDSKGNFVDLEYIKEYKLPPPQKEDFILLLPGKETEFKIIAEPKWKKIISLSKEAFVLDWEDMVHFLEKPEIFKVYGIYFVEKDFAKRQEEELCLSNIFWGRVISEPIEIKLK